MKGILINNTILVKENSRGVDRYDNIFDLNLKVTPYIGAEFTEEAYQLQKTISINVRKNECEESWTEYKDMSTDDIMTVLYDRALTYSKVINTELPKPIYTTVQDPKKGEVSVISGYEELSEDYKAKVEYEAKYFYLKELAKLLVGRESELIDLR